MRIRARSSNDCALSNFCDCARGAHAQQLWRRDLHYAHQGGFGVELYDSEQTLVRRWNNTRWFGGGVAPANASVAPESCSVDGTQQSATITLPDEPCNGCFLRFQREVRPLQWFFHCSFTCGLPSGKRTC